LNQRQKKVIDSAAEESVGRVGEVIREAGGKTQKERSGRKGRSLGGRRLGMRQMINGFNGVDALKREAALRAKKCVGVSNGTKTGSPVGEKFGAEKQALELGSVGRPSRRGGRGGKSVLRKWRRPGDSEHTAWVMSTSVCRLQPVARWCGYSLQYLSKKGAEYALGGC